MWNKTAIDDVNAANVEEIPFARHATSLENAIVIAKTGVVRASHEKQTTNRLFGTRHSIIWLSPNDWQYHEGNIYGCVAFDYDWKKLIDVYGDRAYGLQEVDSTTPTARVFVSNFDHGAEFGVVYDPEVTGGPWRRNNGQHYMKRNCVLQIAVDTPEMGLGEFMRIKFIDQKRAIKGSFRLRAESAARLFLSRVVGEQVPAIPNFAGLDAQTGQPHESLLYACGYLWQQLDVSFQDLHGPVHHDTPDAIPLARALLDRYSRNPALGCYRKTITGDAAALASMYHSTADLLLSCRAAVADWAGIQNPADLNNDTWPQGV